MESPNSTHHKYSGLSRVEISRVLGRISRWQLALSEFDLDIHHLPGKELAIADGLSRIQGYPSAPARTFETDMQAFIAEEPAEDRQFTAGDRSTDDPGSRNAEENRERDWKEWLDDL